jgi:uncharacterized protein
VRRLCAILLLTFGFRLFADEVIPPPPAAYFNDYAGVVSAGTAAQLNQTLENFERQSSDQIVVAIFPKMQSDSSIDDYTVRVARSWQVGQKGKNNGAVLFVFVQDHKMFIEVGYGLEGVLPDALCKRIIDEEITPRFRAGDFDGGLTAGVQAMLAATKGEYQGTGTTVAGQGPAVNAHHGANDVISTIILILLIILFVYFRFFFLPLGGIFYSGRGSSGGSWSGGGGFGGGGGFSGGGGSSGGGGAGGSW